MVVELLLGFAIMFLGLGLTELLTPFRKRGALASMLLGACLILAAFEWHALEPTLSQSLRDSLASIASNGYVWLGMLLLVWGYLAFAISQVASTPTRDFPPSSPAAETDTNPTTTAAERKVPALPEHVSQRDKEHLIKRLKRGEKQEKRAIQIVYNNSERCSQIASDLSEVLAAANWIQPSPPSLIAPNSATKPGIYTTSSLTDPAESSARSLYLALIEVGIECDFKRDPELRIFNHAFVYVNE